MPVKQWKLSTRTSNPETLISSLTAANGAAQTTGTAISNDDSAEKDLFVNLELNVTFAAAPTDGAIISVFFKNTVDGTNFGADQQAPERVGQFQVKGTGTTQRLMLPRCLVPVRDFHVTLVNLSGANFSSGTLKGDFYKYESA